MQANIFLHDKLMDLQLENPVCMISATVGKSPGIVPCCRTDVYPRYFYTWLGSLKTYFNDRVLANNHSILLNAILPTILKMQFTRVKTDAFFTDDPTIL